VGVNDLTLDKLMMIRRYELQYLPVFGINELRLVKLINFRSRCSSKYLPKVGVNDPTLHIQAHEVPSAEAPTSS
jgi:hypothetical protein